MNARGLVEVSDVDAAEGDHRARLLRRLPVLLPPVGNERRSGGGGIRCPDHPAVLAVALGPADYVAAPQGVQRVAVPRLLLAPDLRQLYCVKSSHESAECSACVDLGQLPVVADEHQLGVSMSRLACELADCSRPDHSGFVNDEHGALEKGLLNAALTSYQRRAAWARCM